MNDATFHGDGKVAYVPVVVNATPKSMTNADRIRAMSDEELAKFIRSHPWHPRGMLYADDCLLDWLRQEAKEGE